MAELDWRKLEDYAYLKGFDLHAWAWEFLRRNPEYRKAYFALEAMATKGILQEIEQDGAKREAFWALHVAATEPWGLKLPANPRYPYGKEPVFFTRRAGVTMPSAWKAPDPAPEDPWPGYPATLVLQFDLHYSPDVLAAIAAEQLTQCAHRLQQEFAAFEPLAPRKTRRFQAGNFVRYLRILDAEQSGATPAKMIQALLSDEARGDPARSLESFRETAHSMASEGYRDLLLLPPRDAGILSRVKFPED